MNFLLFIFVLFHITQASIKILEPQALIDKFPPNGMIDVVYGNFGHIPYGQTVVGYV